MNTINIDNKEYPVRFGFRAMVEFEKLTGLNSNIFNAGESNIDSMLNLYYCGLIAGCKREKVKVEYTIEDFIDAVDDDNSILSTMGEIFTHQMNTNTTIGKK